jgi:hypothetical protein
MGKVKILVSQLEFNKKTQCEDGPINNEARFCIVRLQYTRNNGVATGA